LNSIAEQYNIIAKFGTFFVSHPVYIVFTVCKIFCLHPSLYLLVSWAWLDWPLTWLTNRRPSVLWRSWFGHLTCKIVPKMTSNVSSGMLNPTIPYDTPTYELLWLSLSRWQPRVCEVTMTSSVVELCVADDEPRCLRHPWRPIQASEADASWKTADQSQDYKNGTRAGARSRWPC